MRIFRILYKIVFTGLLVSPQISFSQYDSVVFSRILEMSLEEIGSLKVSSVTLHKEELKELPATVYLTTKQEIENYGFRDLKDVLFYTPGIEYAFPHSWLQGGQRGVVGNFSKTKLLINGTEINLLYTGEAFIGEQYTLDNIEHVEIIQGPGSVIYGADAFSGVINMVTKEPESDKISANLGVNSGFSQDGMKLYRGFGTIKGKMKKLSYFLGYSYTQMKDVDYSDFVVTSKFSRYNQTIRKRLLESGAEPYKDLNIANSLSIGLKYRPDSRNELSLDYYHYYDQDGGGQESPEISFQHFKSIRKQELIVGSYKLNINDIHSMQIRSHFRLENELNDWTLREPVNGEVSPVYSWDLVGSKSFYVETYWNVNLTERNNYSIIGSGFREDNLSDIFFELDTFEHLEKFRNPNNYFVFLQSQQNLFNNKLKAIIGIRKDFHSIYNAPVTFRGGINYNAAQGLTLKYFYSEAFRAPTLFDLEINDQLRPERNHTNELSAVYELKDKLSIQSAFYYSNIYDQIVTTIDPSIDTLDIWIASNSGTDSFSGVELVSKFSGQNWFGECWVNYTYFSDGLKVAPWKISLKTTRKFKRNHRVSMLAKFTSSIETDMLNEQGVEEFTMIPYFMQLDLVWLKRNISITKSMNIDFQLAIKNLLNKKNFYPNLRGNDPSRFKVQGRTVYGKLILYL